MSDTENLFDEQWYVEQYPDVAEAIRRGEMPSALAHYNAYGKYEGRLPVRPTTLSITGVPTGKDAFQQEAAIRSRLEHLSGDQLLAFECEAIDTELDQVVERDTAKGKIFFLTIGKLKNILSECAWKLVSAKPTEYEQVQRFVFHVRLYRRTVLLLLDGPNSGKTTFARKLRSCGIRCISIDDHITQLRSTPASPLVDLVKQYYRPERLDELYRKIHAENLMSDFLDSVITKVNQRPGDIVGIEGALSNKEIVDALVRKLEAARYFIWRVNRVGVTGA